MNSIKILTVILEEQRAMRASFDGKLLNVETGLQAVHAKLNEQAATLASHSSSISSLEAASQSKGAGSFRGLLFFVVVLVGALIALVTGHTDALSALFSEGVLSKVFGLTMPALLGGLVIAAGLVAW